MSTSYISEQTYPEELVNYQRKVDEYLRNNLVDLIAIPDDKFRIKALKDIITFEKTNIDCYDMRRYSGKLDSKEYVELLEKSSTNLHRAAGYIETIRLANKYAKMEEKELKKLEFQDTKVGKVLAKIFKK